MFILMSNGDIKKEFIDKLARALLSSLKVSNLPEEENENSDVFHLKNSKSN